MKKLLFILGFVVLAGTNIFVISGVIYNRSKGPVTLIELTERELQLPYWTNDENSGLALQLEWRTIGRDKNDFYLGSWDSPTWFNEIKLKELGFDIENTNSFVYSSEYYKVPIPKKAFVVLEYDGKLYKEALKRAEKNFEKEKNILKADIESNSNDFEWAETHLRDERESETRLFAIDAGLDANKLKEQYNDQTRFIVVPGIVKMRCNYNDKKDNEAPVGYISRLCVEKIHVPLKYRKTFDPIMSKEKPKKYKFNISQRHISNLPRYKVKLAYGKRFEPWIQSVQAIE